MVCGQRRGSGSSVDGFGGTTRARPGFAVAADVVLGLAWRLLVVRLVGWRGEVLGVGWLVVGLVVAWRRGVWVLVLWARACGWG